MSSKFQLFGKIFPLIVHTSFSNEKWNHSLSSLYLETSATMHALHYGGCVFEGMKMHRGEDPEKGYIFRMEDHMRRLRSSCERMGLPPVPDELFIAALKKMASLCSPILGNKKYEGVYLRPFIYAATDDTLGVSANKEFIFAVTACPHFTHPTELTTGCRIETQLARTFPGGVGTAKAAGNYAAARLSDSISAKMGAVTLWSQNGLLQEFTTMSLFIIEGKELKTPKLNDTILDGITRKTILEIARGAGYIPREMEISHEYLWDGLTSGTITEVFGVGTAITIQQIDTVYMGNQTLMLNTEPRNAKAYGLFHYLEDIYHARKHLELTYEVLVPAHSLA